MRAGPQESQLLSVLSETETPGVLFRRFFASRGQKRQAWLRALDARSFDQLGRLRRMAEDYGTAAAVEFKDAIIDILDMRRRQGRGG